jgi:uncharacterized protein YcgL (UPF0745 family)
MDFLISLVFILGLQGGSAPPVADDFLSPAEQSQMAKANGVERRIKIYAAASKRLQQVLHEAIGKDEFQSVPDTLNRWTSLLVKSLEDMEANLKSKKRSRALINYEIQVRKAITDTQGYRVRAPVDQQDVFDSCLDRAEAIRKRFVEILFPR